MGQGDDFRDEVLQRHATARALVHGNAPIAVLHIGAAHSAVAAGQVNDEVRVMRFALGYAGVPATLFHGDIPTPLELENAIAAVEDEVMPVTRQLAGVTELVTTDPRLLALATVANKDPKGALSIDAVEWLFDELSRVALGGPASRLPFASGKESAATLVILREFMHHGGIGTLRCLG